MEHYSFQGPYAYISPSWYPSKQEHHKVVPTWNYQAIHAHAPAEFFEDADRLLAIVTRLTALHEGEMPTPRAAPPCFLACRSSREILDTSLCTRSRNNKSLLTRSLRRVKSPRETPCAEAMAATVRGNFSHAPCTLEHMADVLQNAGADAVLAASIFHFGEYTVGDVKRFLAERGVPVRLS
jgi:hypothetical protein